MKVILIKKWCDEQLSPLAWQRIVMKNFDVFKSIDWGITELSNPNEDMEISEDLLDIVMQTVRELYKVDLLQHFSS